MKKTPLFLMLVATSMGMVSCEKLNSGAPASDQVMDQPLEELTMGQVNLFQAGAEEFDEVYTSETGLGPYFVANSCGSCHAGDNRGHLSTLLTRFGQTDSTGNQFMNFGGPQIQQFALPGHSPENLPAGVAASGFIAPIIAGSGFIELVPDSELLALSDPYDANGDGISGVPNWNTIPDFVEPGNDAVSQNGKYICRFGRKASTFNLLQQTVTAFQQDMGITSTFKPLTPLNPADGMGVSVLSDPEISDNGVHATVFYLQVLQKPIQRNQDDPDVIEGKNIFNNIGCQKCHVESLHTGYSPVAQLSYQSFKPYSDLLLHDMGNELNDGYTEGSAAPAEWRTTPLWGLGLAGNVQGNSRFLLHDGRAHSLNEAILLHGGEGAISRTAYTQLSASDKTKLEKFLNSL